MTPRDASPAGGPRRGVTAFVFYWLPVLAYIGLIFSLSSIKGNDLPGGFPNMDKIAHLLEYSLLGLLLGRAIRFTLTGRGRLAAAVATIVVGAMVGFADEMYQRGVPQRHSDIRDWVADVLALSAAVAFTQLIHSRSLRKGAAPSTGDAPR